MTNNRVTPILSLASVLAIAASSYATEPVVIHTDAQGLHTGPIHERSVQEIASVAITVIDKSTTQRVSEVSRIDILNTISQAIDEHGRTPQVVTDALNAAFVNQGLSFVQASYNSDGSIDFHSLFPAPYIFP